MGFKIKTRADVDEIFAAKLEVNRLSSEWYKAIRDADQLKASAAYRRMNKIRREIQSKYDVIL